MSSPSMTLKCGSLNSFFIAELRTAASTSRATYGEKSESRVNLATSSSVGSGTGCGAAFSLVAASGLLAGAAGNGGNGSSATTVDGAAGSGALAPLLAPALRRDQRDRNPSPSAITCAPQAPGRIA